jgi:hypothetical protein
MKNGLYRIEARMEIEELRNGGHCMIIGDSGMAFAEIHPIKIKSTPKKEKPIVGLDGTVYTQDEDKQGWTGHTELKVEPLDVVRSVKSICLLMDCISCPLRDWCLNLPVGGRPTEWCIPKKED